MKQHAFSLCVFAGLAAAVGIMSWRDLHPAPVSAHAPKSIDVVTYFAGGDITAPALIPNNNMPLVIDTGVFSTSASGEPLFTPHGLAPTLFAQRQMSLQFSFETLPRAPSAAFTTIDRVVQDWVREGNMVSALVFNYAATTPEERKAYASLLAAAAKHYKKPQDGYDIIAAISLSFPAKALEAMAGDVSRFLIAVPGAPIAPKTRTTLQSLHRHFILRFPAGVAPAALNAVALGKLDYLAGVTLTLDPQKPLAQKKPVIGIFPKL